jgi:tetratricopeptide (TPR) repeat protein/pSer/pThr/pTyr-binding forkhead associated (FHA) protein
MLIWDFLKKIVRIRTHIKVAEECLERGEYEKAMSEAERALELVPGHKEAEKIRSEAGSKWFRRLLDDAKRHYDNYVQTLDETHLSIAEQRIEKALQIRHGVSERERDEARELRFSLQNVTEHVSKFRRAREHYDSGELDACIRLLGEIRGFPKADSLRPKAEEARERARKLYEEAADELDRGNPDEAERLISEAVKRYSDYPGREAVEERLKRVRRAASLVEESKRLFSAGKLDEAYLKAREAWLLSDGIGSEWYERVSAQLASRYRSEAQEAADSGELELAISTYEKLLEVNPYDPEARSEVERLRGIRSELERIVEEGGKALGTGDYALAFEKLASAKGLGFKLSLIDSLDRRLNAELERIKEEGLSEFREGRLNDAVRIWSILPQPSEQFEEIKGKLEEAERRIELAEERIRSAERLIEMRDFDTARGLVDEAIELFPKNPEAIELKTKVERKLRVEELIAVARKDPSDIDSAWNALQEALSIDPQDGKLLDLQGEIKPRVDELVGRCERIERMLEEGDLAGAEAELESALSLGFKFKKLQETAEKVKGRREQVDQLLSSAERAMGEGEFGSAIRKIERALELHRDHPKAREMLREAKLGLIEQERLRRAKAYLNAGDHPNAIRELEGLLGEIPSSPEGRELLERAKEEFSRKTISEAERLLNEGRLDEAERRCRELLSVIPENETVGELMGRVQARREEAMTLLEEVRRSIEEGELSSAGEKLKTLRRLDAGIETAELERKLEAKERARRSLEEARRCEAEGRISEGMRLAREAFELDPSLSEAREIFQRLQMLTGISGPMVIRSTQGDMPEVFVIPQRVVDIGRIYPGVRNDVYFRLPNISRRHAQLVNEGGRFTITDRGSSYGTFVNGVEVGRGEVRELRDGDVIRLGQVVELKFNRREGASTGVLTVLDLPDEVKRWIGERIDRINPLMLETIPRKGIRLVFTDEEGEITLGGGDEEDIRDERMGPGRGARLIYRDDRFWIEPIGEVLLNGERLDERRVLQPGDEIGIGGLTLKVEEAREVIL